MTKLWEFENRQFCMGDCMKPGCMGKSNTNYNLPAPTDLTGNPYGKKKLFFKDATQKSASVVPRGIYIKRDK
jgi:hypothetical protein